MIDENVLIIGATGDLGIAATQAFLTNSDDKLTLFARSANRISIQDGSCESVFVGDVMRDQDLI